MFSIKSLLEHIEFDKIVCLVLVVFFSISITNNIIHPKPENYPPKMDVNNVKPNHEYYFTLPITLKPIYGADSAIPRIGVFYFNKSIASRAYISLDNNSFIEIDSAYRIPIISDIMSLYDPGIGDFGLKEMDEIDISKNRTVNFYFKFISSSNLPKSGRVASGTIRVNYRNTYGIGFPIYVILFITLCGFFISIFRFFERKKVALIIIAIIWFLLVYFV